MTNTPRFSSGIDYGMKVSQERSDDISIIGAVAAVWGDKLSNSSEHVYYRPRIRRESQTLIRVTFPNMPELIDQFKKQSHAPAGWNDDNAPLTENRRDREAYDRAS